MSFCNAAKCFLIQTRNHKPYRDLRCQDSSFLWCFSKHLHSWIVLARLNSSIINYCWDGEWKQGRANAHPAWKDTSLFLQERCNKETVHEGCSFLAVVSSTDLSLRHLRPSSSPVSWDIWQLRLSFLTENNKLNHCTYLHYKGEEKIKLNIYVGNAVHSLIQ